MKSSVMSIPVQVWWGDASPASPPVSALGHGPPRPRLRITTDHLLHVVGHEAIFAANATLVEKRYVGH